MELSGDNSDYDEWEESETDIEDLPDEELIVVLRDEQNSIKEAQRLIHKEIKSIRRELKRFLRQYAATRTDQQGSDEHSLHEHRSIDSGLGETNYATSTECTTASEWVSSHGDSETGYQAFLEYDTDGSAGNRKQSSEVYESGSGYEEDVAMGYSLQNYKEPEGEGAASAQQSRAEDGFRFDTPTHWNDSETNQALDDHTLGRNLTYEDAYSMMRRRHSRETPTGNMKSKSSCDRQKSTTHHHGPSVYSKGHESIQGSEDELRCFQDFSDSTVNSDADEQPRRYGSQSISSSQITKQVKTSSQLATKIGVEKLTKSGPGTPESSRDTGSPRPSMPVLGKTQSSKFLLRPSSMSAVHSDRLPSVASDTSENIISIHQGSTNARTSAMSSGDEARDSPRFSVSSYDSYIDTKYSSQSPRSPQGLSRQKDLSKHQQRQGSMTSARLQKTPSSQTAFPQNASNTASRNPNSRARQSYSGSDERHRNTFKDEYWKEGSLSESQSALTRNPVPTAKTRSIPT